MTLRLGTRGSALAMTQSTTVARALEAHGAKVELVRVRTEGDADTTRPFAQVGEPGVFVRALENALVEDRIDLAVHSFKDLPSQEAQGLRIAAVPRREDPRDRLLMRPEAFDEKAEGLPLVQGARIGTAAARRSALLAALRPDLEPCFLRGNVDTRLSRLAAGDFDAILLAAAGLDRLAAADGPRPAEELISVNLDPEVFVPAPSQGAVACQVRADDEETGAAVALLDDPTTRAAVEIERRLLTLIEAGCDVPFGAHARAVEGGHELIAALERDGTLARARAIGDDPQALAQEAFRQLTEQVSG